MATARLTNDDRSNLTSKLCELVRRPGENLLLDMSKDAQKDFISSLMPDEFWNSVDYLLAVAQCVPGPDKSELVRTGKGGVQVYIRATEHQGDPNLPANWADQEHPGAFSVTLQPEVAFPRIPYYAYVQGSIAWDTIVSWCRRQQELHKWGQRAAEYLESAIDACSSAGQIKRILPGIEEFLPKSIQATFADAERRSRIPSTFTPDPLAYETVMNMLAMGHLVKPLDWWRRRELATVITYVPIVRWPEFVLKG